MCQIQRVQCSENACFLEDGILEKEIEAVS